MAEREINEYDHMLMTPLIISAVMKDAENWADERSRRDEAKKDVIKGVYGSGVTPKEYLSPSTASMCVRWAAYQTPTFQENIKPIPPDFEQSMNMSAGSSIHYSILSKLKPFGLTELGFKLDDPAVSGRLDFLTQNPQTKKWHVMDLKVVGEYSFKSVTRDGLPDHLKKDKRIFKAKPEAEKQVLLYMWAMDKQGYDIESGCVFYLYRNDFDEKECLIPWDEEAKEKAEYFVNDLRCAQSTMEKGELPDPTVEKGSEYMCKSMCPFRHVCEPGRGIASGKVDLKRRRQVSRQARALAKKSAEERRIEIEKIQALQPRLF